MNFKSWSPLTAVPDEILNETRLAHVFDREALLVTNNDEVFALGTNDSGCLGVEDTAPRVSLEPVVQLNQKRVKSFVFGGAAGSLFVVAHCYTGAVYMWGKDPRTGNTNLLKPTLIDQVTKKVIEVACGRAHCLLLNIEGEVFGLGGNESGQLGINSTAHTANPTKIVVELAGKLVTKISCGLYFSTAVLDSGEVFTWGSDGNGQLGLNTIGAIRMIPTKVSIPSDPIIKKIMCGSSHVLAINDVCELYVWGYNNEGQLGLGDTVSRLVPVKNEAVGRVTNVAASPHSRTSAAITENYEVLMWGECSGLNIVQPRKTLYESLHEVFANFSKPCFTYKSITRHPGYELIDETLRNAFEDKESSDLTIMAEGKEIFVHRVILRLRSDYFRTLLQEPWFTETERCITLDQSYNAMYAYLKYLYYDELKAEPKLALELLALADEYNDRSLKRLCEKAIQHGIRIENVASLYAVALKLDAKKLLKNCLSFAANHMSELMDTSGFDDWDVHTMKAFFRECRKRKLFRS